MSKITLSFILILICSTALSIMYAFSIQNELDKALIEIIEYRQDTEQCHKRIKEIKKLNPNLLTNH